MTHVIAHPLASHNGRNSAEDNFVPVVYGFSQESDGSTVRNASNIARPITGRHGDPGIVAYQCHGNNVGPMGTLREGNGGLTGGVPFVMEIHGGSKRKDRPSGGFYVREMDTSKPLDTGGLNPNCAQGGVVAFQLTGDRDNPNVSTYENIHPTILANPMSDRRPAIAQPAQPAYGVRRLTPTECERLQGFPDGWTDNGQSDSARYRQLGNAVCVPVAEWIGRQILRTISLDSNR